ncbi:MAG: hypothetical protein H6625_00225 [Bdellovibrionaceae bacterium]|nr:hypothetical protein [Pseudobdellovibrionaceae bacterium]
MEINDKITFAVWFFLVVLISSACTRKSVERSVVRIQLPSQLHNSDLNNAEINHSVSKNDIHLMSAQSTGNTSKFELPDPTQLSQINCYIIVVGAGDLKSFNFSGGTATSSLPFGVGRFYHPGGSTIEVLVPSGLKRTITVLGSVSTNNSCVSLPAGKSPAYSNLSRPLVIGEETRDLRAGDVEVSIKVALTNKIFDTSTWFNSTTNSEIAPIVLSSPSPSTPSFGVSVGQTKALSIVASGGGNLNYVWKLNGNVSSSIVANNNIATYTGAAVDLGDNLIEVSVSNSNETKTYSWVVNTNHFSSHCNSLAPGNICTLTGVYDIGNESDPILDNSRLKVYPGKITKDDTDGYFISDNVNSVIWYHNLNTYPRNILGTSIAAGKIKVVVGTGIVKSAVAGANARNIPINVYSAPADIAWDATQGRLFFTELVSNKVWQVDSFGALSHIFGGGASNTDGVAGTLHQCSGPRGLAFDGINNLFISCTNNYRIKRLDFSVGNTGYLVGGNGTSGSIDGVALSSQIKNVYDMTLDSNGNLYWIESVAPHCKLRVYNNTGGVISFMNSNITVPPGNIASISGVGGGCSPATLSTDYNLAKFPGPQSVLLDESGGNINGFYISFYSGTTGNAVLYLNNKATPQTIANVTVNSTQAEVIWGVINSPGTPTYGNSGTASKLYRPVGLSFLGNNQLLVADSYNNLLQRLDLASGIVAYHIGGSMIRKGTEGQSLHPAASARLSSPRYSSYDSTKNILYFGDNPNSAEVRSLDLSTGELQTAVGGGGTADSNNDIPPLTSLIPSNSLFGLAIAGDQLLYSTFVTSNCRIRSYNRGLSIANIFNVSVLSQKLSSVAFNGTCSGTFNESDPVNTVGIDGPQAIATDPTGNLYGVLKNQHCIFKIDPNGLITTTAGACGTSGNSNGTDLFTARFNSPTYIESDPLYPHNLFLTDAINNVIRYVNLGASNVNVLTATVNTGTVNSIITEASAGGKMAGIAAFANQICYSAGSNLAKVVCKDRESGALTLRVGSNSSISGAPLGFEQENIPATSVILADPQGLSFDSAGNLYILDYASHTLRKVKRWF